MINALTIGGLPTWPYAVGVCFAPGHESKPRHMAGSGFRQEQPLSARRPDANSILDPQRPSAPLRWGP